jgi:hypothetical protein
MKSMKVTNAKMSYFGTVRSGFGMVKVAAQKRVESTPAAVTSISVPDNDSGGQFIINSLRRTIQRTQW